MLDPWSEPAIASSSWIPAAAARPAGTILHLCALGLVAAATVGAFFGIGLVLLMHQPAGSGHREPISATVARVSAATTPLLGPAAAAAAVPPAASRQTGFAPLPVLPMLSGERSPTATAPATVPSAPVSSAPVSSAPVSSAPAPSASPGGSETGSAPAATAKTPAAKVSAAPPPGASPHLSTAAIAALLARGDALCRDGDFASARLPYQQAFDAGEGRGGLGIGATYDPTFLNRGGRHGLSGDPAVATFWYRSALALGAAEAEDRLAVLEARSPR